MGNDISMLRRAAVAAGMAALVLAAGCVSRGGEHEQVPSEDTGGAGLETQPIAPSEPVALKEDAPLRYVVKKGDTLWAISNKYLRDSWQWPELWYVNPKVKNPHLIYPGDELFLYFVDGAPKLARAGEGPAGAEGGPAGPTGPGGPTEPVDVLPPGGEGSFTPTAREMPVDQAITAIPAEQIRAFLRGPRIIDEDELDEAPYIVAFEEKKLLGAADSIAYVLDIDEDSTAATYQVVHRSKEYEDPDDGDTIGFEVIPVAEAEMRVVGDPSTVYLLSSIQEARIGDFLLAPQTDPMALRFIPHAPKEDVDGKIISVFNGLSQIGQYQIVTLNRGTEHGLEAGHVLSVFQAGRKAKDPYALFGGKVQLPDSKAGTLMVFNVGERVSHALVMSATRAIHLGDRVERPTTTAN
jgi:hypothetical protein